MPSARVMRREARRLRVAIKTPKGFVGTILLPFMRLWEADPEARVSLALEARPTAVEGRCLLLPEKLSSDEWEALARAYTDDLVVRVARELGPRVEEAPA